MDELHLNFPQGYRLSQVSGRNPTAIEDFIATRNRNFRELSGSSDQRVEDLAAFIGTISVDKEHRGRGLARGLIRTALSIAAGAGMKEAFLSVNAGNSTALGLYLEEGFVVVKAMSCLACCYRGKTL